MEEWVSSRPMPLRPRIPEWKGVKPNQRYRTPYAAYGGGLAVYQVMEIFLYDDGEPCVWWSGAMSWDRVPHILERPDKYVLTTDEPSVRGAQQWFNVRNNRTFTVLKLKLRDSGLYAVAREQVMPPMRISNSGGQPEDEDWRFIGMATE